MSVSDKKLITIDIDKIDFIMTDRIGLQLDDPAGDMSIVGLAASIRKRGLIHPITVRLSADGKRYEKIAGGRRILAFKLLKIPTIDAYVLPAGTSNFDAISLLVEENTQRENFDVLSGVEILLRLLAIFIDELLEQRSISKEDLMNSQKLIVMGKDSLYKAKYVKEQMAKGDNSNLTQTQSRIYYGVLDFCENMNISLQYLIKKTQVLGFDDFIKKLLIPDAINLAHAKNLHSIYINNEELFKQFRLDVEKDVHALEDEGDIDFDEFKQTVREKTDRYYDIFKHGSSERAAYTKRISQRLSNMASSLALLEFAEEERKVINTNLKQVEELIEKKRQTQNNRIALKETPNEN